ncbi:hypothetical protein HK103_003356 [Boothiomyces macroporosus]|uniref:OPT family small oligopeptide transporter n=1 Tax=Boothiomyces macroporosus TaxID=261099 RepID=A0AAD5UL33_9FUNG|nr:hypothetical protein HK103_003356 [Boothiomyces macroporosus]
MEEIKPSVDLEKNDTQVNLEPDVELQLVEGIDANDTEFQDAVFAKEFRKGLILEEDDRNIPTLTIRSVLIGTVFAILLGFVNIVASFRNNSFVVPVSLVNILAYPIGIFLASVLPNVKLFGVSLNPGSFSVKEHVIINIVAGAAGGKPYGLNNVIAQRLIFNDHGVNFWNSLAWVLMTQMVGYGIAGLCRPFLVKPTAMLWPGALSSVSFFNAFHDTGKLETDKYRHSLSRYSAFWLAFLLMFVYSFLPSYFAQALGAVSILCFMTTSKNARWLGSASYGPGVLSLTFDWSLISQQGWYYFPFYTTVNAVFGAIIWGWILGPIIQFNKTFNPVQLKPSFNYGGGSFSSFASYQNGTINIGGKEVPDGFVYSGVSPNGDKFNTTVHFDPWPTYNNPSLYDGSNGNTISLIRVTWDKTGHNVVLTPDFAITYFFGFVSLGAVISQVLLWYSKDVYRQFREALAQKDSELDAQDPHYKIMKSYGDIKELHYLIFFLASTVITILVCEFTPFAMPWWATILCILCGFIFSIPIGIIQAITGYQAGLNILTQIVGGFTLTGDSIGVMAFKTLGYDIVIQSLALVGDLKLGHYMHIAPKAMVAAQFIGTLIGALTNNGGAFWALGAIFLNSTTGDALPMKDLPAGWKYSNYLTFASAGGIWGAIGPVRFWGGVYSALNWGYFIGFALPFIPWLLNKAFPSKYWHMINIVVISNAKLPVGNAQAGVVTPFIIAWFCQYYLYRYKREFWEKYVWIICIAFDSAAALVAVLPPIMRTIYVEDSVGPFNPNVEPDYYCRNVDYNGNPIA